MRVGRTTTSRPRSIGTPTKNQRDGQARKRRRRTPSPRRAWNSNRLIRSDSVWHTHSTLSYARRGGFILRKTQDLWQVAAHESEEGPQWGDASCGVHSYVHEVGLLTPPKHAHQLSVFAAASFFCSPYLKPEGPTGPYIRAQRSAARPRDRLRAEADQAGPGVTRRSFDGRIHTSMYGERVTELRPSNECRRRRAGTKSPCCFAISSPSTR